jgi:hypothetical protein
MVFSSMQATCASDVNQFRACVRRLIRPSALAAKTPVHQKLKSVNSKTTSFSLSPELVMAEISG